MTLVTEWVDIGVPARVAYQEWLRFEEFPNFMWGVLAVHRISDTRTRWQMEISGVKREFDAEVTELQPDRRIAWQATGGVRQTGEATFTTLDNAHCRVTVRMKFKPHGLGEQAADRLGFVQRRIKEAVEQFRGHVEAHWTAHPDNLRRVYNEADRT